MGRKGSEAVALVRRGLKMQWLALLIAAFTFVLHAGEPELPDAGEPQDPD